MKVNEKGKKKISYFILFVIITIVCLMTMLFFNNPSDMLASKKTWSGLKADQKNKKQSVLSDKSKLDIKVLFIGVKKCGTTTLKTFSSLHPEVVVSSNLHICRTKPYKSYQVIQNNINLAKYKQKVAMVANNECIYNMKEFNVLQRPEKIIVLLCDPTLRAYSDYKHIVRVYSYKKKFEKIIPEAISNIKNHQDQEDFSLYMSQLRYSGHLDYSIVSAGIYHEYLKEFFRRYSKEDILILSGAELKKSPFTVMRQIEEFLGIKHFYQESYFAKNNKTGFYCFQTFRKLKCIGESQNRNFPPPPQLTLNILKDFYHPFNERLFDLLNRTFDWM